jgi:hypothetical protein
MNPLLISDIVKQLRVYMPWYTDLFTDFISIDYFTGPGPTVGVSNKINVPTAAPHGLAVGDVVIVKDMTLHTPISGASRDDDHGIIEVVADATDITYTPLENTAIELGGFVSAEWNGTKILQGIYMTDPGKIAMIKFSPRPSVPPELPVGTDAYIKETRPTFRGLWTVTDVPTSKDVVLQRDSMPELKAKDAAISGLQMCSVSNIVAAPDIYRAIEMYTAQAPAAKSWLYVVPTGRSTSNDRLAKTDAIAEFGPGDINRLYSMMTFAVIAIVDTSDSISAGVAMDLLQGEVFSALLKSLFGYAKSDCGIDFKTVPVSDTIERYETSYMVHSYRFESTQTLDYTDGFSDPQDFAADQIEYIQHPGSIDNPETLKTTISTR